MRPVVAGAGRWLNRVWEAWTGRRHAHRPWTVWLLALVIAVAPLWVALSSPWGGGTTTAARHGLHARIGRAYARRTHVFGGRLVGLLCRPTAGALPPPGACGDPWRRALRPNPAGLLTAPPSVSVQAIQLALQAAGSPLADIAPRREGRTYAEALWDRGRQSGIDPAVVMALFWIESHDGTLGMAVQTHDLANRRPLADEQARCGADGCYAYDADWFVGIDRIYALLRQFARSGVSTVDQLAPLWAPPSDANNVATFTESVHETLAALALASQESPSGRRR